MTAQRPDRERESGTHRHFAPDALLLRVLAHTPAWVASALLHLALFGILVQVTVISKRAEDRAVYSVSIADSTGKELLDEGSKDLERPPTIEPVIDPAKFEWDETQTDADAPFENVELSSDLPRLISLYGNFGARSQGGRAEASRTGGATKASESCVELALEWLARHQDSDGAWRAGGYSQHCIAAAPCKTVASPLTTVDSGLTGLATLAYLGAGYTDVRGRFSHNVHAALQYLLKMQQDSGFFGPKSGKDPDIYNHAICSLAVCEAYGMTQKLSYRRAAEKAIAYSLKVQHVDGGWGYMRRQIGQFRSDVSVTGWQAMALKSAQMAGLTVPASTWRSLVAYVDSASDDKGCAGYTSAKEFVTPMNPSTLAVGLLCRQFAPKGADSKMAAELTDLLVGILPTPANEGFFYYGYYGSLSLYQYGGPKWDRWNTHIREKLVSLQERQGCAAGSWDPGSKRWALWAGRIYSTAMAALTLEVYYRYLPIHRGYLDETPEAAALEAYRKSRQAYSQYLILADEQAPADGQAEACERAISLLQEYRLTESKCKPKNDDAARKRNDRLAATAIRLATLLMRSEHYAECAQEMQAFSAAFPDYADQETPRKLFAAALALVANDLQGTGDEQNAAVLRRMVAEERYKQIVRDANQPAEIYRQVADYFHSQGDWLRAAELYRQLLEQHSADAAVERAAPALKLRLGECLLKSNMLTEARELLERLAVQERSAATLRALADCYRFSRDFEKALGVYLEIREGSDTGGDQWWQAQYGVANTLMLLGRVDECRKLIEVQQLLRPGLGGAELKASFLQLLDLCGKISANNDAKSGT